MGQGSGHCLAGSTPSECSPSSSYLRLRVLFQDIQVVGRFQFSVAVQLISLCCYCFFLVVDWVTLRNLGSWSPGLFHICCSLHGSLLFSRPGILQARLLEWVAFPFFRGSSQPRDQTQVSCIAGEFFTSWAIQVRIPKWVAMPSSMASSQPRDGTKISASPALAGRFFTTVPPGKLRPRQAYLKVSY